MRLRGITFAALSSAGTIQRVLGDSGAACDFGVERAGKVEQNWELDG